MNHAQLLDCTLRDGAYLIDKEFGDATIRGIIKGLMKANIDFIEIGFLQDTGQGEGKTVFLNAGDAQAFIPADKQGSQFTVLADYSRYSINHLDPYTGQSIDAVRECFFKHERYGAIDVCKAIKEKGYKVFIQPVDILGYTDIELIELIRLVNEIEPYCFSIVDTFGSMYSEDLTRVFELIHHNLVPSCKVGFHSHNNMQMSNALSQEFLRMTYGKRNVIVDGTISGMGRGAGNLPTELIAQYMVKKLNYSYDIDAILDIIDDYMDHIRTRCSWGYTTPYFVAGSFSAHVNNVTYLSKKNSIRSKDLRYILNKIGASKRKRYDYDLLESTYLEYLATDIDDHLAIGKLQKALAGKHIVAIAPGSSIAKNTEIINRYIAQKNAVVISINGSFNGIGTDYIYMNNVKRYSVWAETHKPENAALIVTSNITPVSANAIIVSFIRLIKCGWTHVDNSMLMLLRLLDILNVASIGIAGFDGYAFANNYATEDMARANINDDPLELNREIQEMLDDYIHTRTDKCRIKLITESRFHI